MSQTVVAFCGLPGSGKSTLARQLEVEFGWLRLDRDVLREALFASGDGYIDAQKRVLDDHMRRQMRAALDDGRSLVLDGMSFARRTHRQRFAADAGARGADWRLFWIDCPMSLAITRVQADTSHPALDRDAALVERVAAYFETPDTATRIDARRSLAHQWAELLDALRR